MMRFQSRRFGGLFVALVLPALAVAADAAAGVWEPAGTFSAPRDQHTATLLSSGQVLVAGGVAPGGVWITGDEELYDPASNAWSRTGSLAVARCCHTATRLLNGRVLVAGGQNASEMAIDSAELYDPASGTWSPAGSLAAVRDFHTATLLPSGKVLVVGGSAVTAELYDPSSNSWTTTGSLAQARFEHSATLLRSGQVLVVGGVGSPQGALASAELYDSAIGTWSPAGSLATARLLHTATLLPSGKVLVVGGVDNNPDSLASAELYDPGTNSWSGAASLPETRAAHTATLLPSGQVLIAGGVVVAALTSVAEDGTSELYDPATDSWSGAGALITPRDTHTGTLLLSGEVLVTGGENLAGGVKSAELYTSDAKTTGLAIAVSGPTLPSVSQVAAGSGPLTITVTAPTGDQAQLTLTDGFGSALPMPAYGTLSDTTLSTFTSNGNGTFSATATYLPPSTPPLDIKAYLGFTVTQGQNSATHSVTLGGPPLLLFHGLWDSACSLSDLNKAAAGTAALDVTRINYGDDLSCTTNPLCPGGDLSGDDFTSPGIQSCVQNQVADAATRLKNQRISYGSFDAIGHSMGSLVASIYADQAASQDPTLQIGSLVSIGTPWNGTPFADLVEGRKDSEANIPVDSCFKPWLLLKGLEILYHSGNTLNDVVSLPSIRHPIGGGVASLTTGSDQVLLARAAAAPIIVKQIAGQAPASSDLENLGNCGLEIFGDPSVYPPGTVDTLLEGSQQHDLVVPLISQLALSGDTSTIPATHVAYDAITAAQAKSGAVLAELHNQTVFSEALCALHDTSQCTPSPASVTAPQSPAQTTDEIADLLAVNISGTQLPADAVTISAPQTITPFGYFDATVAGTATCSPQTTFVMDYKGTLQESSGASPTITLPAGTGNTSVSTWLVVCSSGDYVATSTAFPIAPPTLLSLQVWADAAVIQPGDTVIVRSTAVYAEGSIDITGGTSTTYSALGPQTTLGGGAYQAKKNGMIFVTVSFGGKIATVAVKVGADEVFESEFE